MTEYCEVLMNLRESKADCVTVEATPEELYGLYHYCEILIEHRLRMGMTIETAALYKVLKALYALRDATLRLQPGEVVEPTPSVSGQAR